MAVSAWASQLYSWVWPKCSPCTCPAPGTRARPVLPNTCEHSATLWTMCISFAARVAATASTSSVSPTGALVTGAGGRTSSSFQYSNQSSHAWLAHSALEPRSSSYTQLAPTKSFHLTFAAKASFKRGAWHPQRSSSKRLKRLAASDVDSWAAFEIWASKAITCFRRISWKIASVCKPAKKFWAASMFSSTFELSSMMILVHLSQKLQKKNTVF